MKNINKYIEYVKKNRSNNTYFAISGVFNTFDKFETDQEDKVFAFLDANYKEPATFNHRLRQFKCAETWLMKNSYLDDTYKEINIENRKSNKIIFYNTLDAIQQEKLINDSKDSIFYECVLFLMQSGLRSDEYFNGFQKNKDIKDGIEIVGKGNTIRPIFFPKDINEFNKPEFKKSQLDYYLLTFAKKHNISFKLTPHILRHTFATNLYHSGVDIFAIKTLLGHSAITSTEKYIHCNNALLKEAFDTQYISKDLNLEKISEKQQIKLLKKRVIQLEIMIKNNGWLIP